MDLCGKIFLSLCLVFCFSFDRAKGLAVRSRKCTRVSEPCDKFCYYDHGTGYCEQCRDICQYAKIQRTEEACKEKCHDYWAATQCKDDEYYDDVVHSCSGCDSLCDNHRVTGTTEDCRNKCQVYLNKQTVKQVASHHSSDILQASRHTAKHDDDDDNDNDDSAPSPQSQALHPGYIVAICVGVFLLVFVPTFTLAYTRCRSKYQPAPQEEDAERQARGGNKPVEETSHGSSGSQHLVISSTQTQLQQTGFSELATDREQ